MSMRICVYAASSSRIAPEFLQAARFMRCEHAQVEAGDPGLVS